MDRAPAMENNQPQISVLSPIMGEYPRKGIGRMKKKYRRHDEEFKRELIARIDGGQITKA